MRPPACDGDAVGPVSVGLAARRGPAAHRRVVRPVVRLGDQLGSTLFPYTTLFRSGQRLPGAELLDRRLAVGGAVGPVARRIEREGAVPVAAGGAGLRRDGRLPL